MTIISDIISATTASTSATGATATREYIIEADGYASLFELIDSDGLPAIDEPHPEAYLQALGLSVGEKVITAIDPRTFRVRVEYSRDPYSSVTISSTVATAQTNRGLEGRIFETLESLAEPNRPKVVPIVSKMVPSVTIEIHQRINGFAATANKLMSYMGKVNAGTFFGGQAGQWLCTSAQAQSTDGGKAYFATFGFLFSDQQGDGGKLGHNCQEAALNAPGTNHPIPNASVEDGSLARNLAVYESVNFSFPGVA